MSEAIELEPGKKYCLNPYYNGKYSMRDGMVGYTLSFELKS